LSNGFIKILELTIIFIFSAFIQFFLKEYFTSGNDALIGLFHITPKPHLWIMKLFQTNLF